MSQQEIIGTALAAQAPVSALVCLGHAAAGHVHWALGGALAIGCSIGMTLATPYVDAMPEKPLRWMLAGMMVFGGVSDRASARAHEGMSARGWPQL